MPRARAQALCDDVENAVGDVLCDGFDELEAILAAEETVALAPEKIREVRVPRQPAPRAPALAVALTRARPQGVDRVMYKFQKHAVDNCRVFKSYSLQQIFGISPQVAERSRAPAGLQPSAPGVHTSEEEQAIDAELAQLRERAHAVRRPTRIALVVSPRAGFLTARARFCSQMPRWTACSKRRARCRSSWSRAPSAWSGSLRSRAAVRASLWRPLARQLTSGRVWCAATPMQEDVEAIAKQVDEVRSVVASIGQGLGQIDGGRPAAAAGGSGDLSGAVAQFEKDKAATSTAGRDDLQKLSAVATQ